jgi:hypothetical protein
LTGRGERGVTVVEAAFVTPLFFMLLLGLFELGLALNDYLGVTNAARSATRTASAAGADDYADYLTLQTLANNSAALQRRQIQRIVIYKASAYGEAPTTTCQNGTSYAGTGTARTGACNTYVASDLSRPKTDFGCLTSQNLDRYWCPDDRDTSLDGTGTDYIGVWIKYNHTWITKMFGSTKTLTDLSVIRLEPRTD